MGLIPEGGKSPGEGGFLTPVFLPGKFQGRGAWQATVHGVPEIWTQLKRVSTVSTFRPRGLCSLLTL